METDNNGILVIEENRKNLEEMKKMYIEEYKKLSDTEKKTEWNYTINKWKVKLGTFGCNVALFFTPRPTRVFGRLGVNIGSFITQKIMKYKNQKQQKKIQSEKDELTANFVNGTGIFENFSIKKKLFDFEQIENNDIVAVRAR